MHGVVDVDEVAENIVKLKENGLGDVFRQFGLYCRGGSTYRGRGVAPVVLTPELIFDLVGADLAELTEVEGERCVALLVELSPDLRLIVNERPVSIVRSHPGSSDIEVGEKPPESLCEGDLEP
jgi:hypothetical protein